MTTFTDDQAREQLSAALDQARAEGEVCIRRSDGAEFIVRPAMATRSSLDVGFIRPERPISMDDVLQAIRDGRERPELPLDIGTVRVDPPPTTGEAVPLVREGCDRG